MANTNPSVHESVQAFAREYGIDDLALSPLGTAAIRLEDGVEVYLEEVPANGKLFVYLDLGNMPPPPQRQACLEHMLSLNCLEQGTLCGTLAIDSSTQIVLLQTGMAIAGLSTKQLAQAIEGLLLHRQRLVDSLKQQHDGAAEQKKALPSTAARLGRRPASKAAP